MADDLDTSIGALGRQDCARGLERALAEPDVAGVLRKLRATHHLAVVAGPCADNLAGYVEVPPGDTIQLCCNRLRTLKQLSSTLRHELVHAVDHASGMNLLNPAHLACSEVRAAALVDCASSWRVLREGCVRRTALASMRVNFPAEVAIRSVDEAMQECLPSGEASYRQELADPPPLAPRTPPATQTSSRTQASGAGNLGGAPRGEGTGGEAPRGEAIGVPRP